VSIKSDLAESKIEYSSLVNSSIYKKLTGATYPLTDIQPPISVVSALTTPDGLGGVAKTLYSYGGLRVHRDYGSLGFNWQKVMNPATGAVSYSEFKQYFPLTGVVSATQSQRCTNTATLPWSGCEVLSQEISNWAVRETGATVDRKVYLPYIQKTVESSWQKSTSAP
jgi:hypothetical protein